MEKNRHRVLEFVPVTAQVQVVSVPGQRGLDAALSHENILLLVPLTRDREATSMPTDGKYLAVESDIILDCEE